jgi:hypothetical protein
MIYSIGIEKAFIIPLLIMSKFRRVTIGHGLGWLGVLKFRQFYIRVYAQNTIWPRHENVTTIVATTWFTALRTLTHFAFDDNGKFV